MSRSPVQDAKKKEATRQRLLETALRVFAERTIDAVNLTEIAEAAHVGMATVYRHFDKKPDLVLAVSAWAWDQYRQTNTLNVDKSGMNGKERFAFFLESFVDLYRNHRDILRFNQFFNAYVLREGIPPERMKPYSDVIRSVQEQFHIVYFLGQQDGTLRTDIPEKEMFSATLHLMLAAVTRYAAGLVYDSGIPPEQELELLKDMLLQRYTK